MPNIFDQFLERRQAHKQEEQARLAAHTPEQIAADEKALRVLQQQLELQDELGGRHSKQAKAFHRNMKSAAKQVVHKVDTKVEGRNLCGAVGKRALFWRNVTCQACKKAGR